jgi:Amt family ammonium transporter
MIPGIGFFYSGFLQRRNALSMIYLSTLTFMAVTLQWFLWGFSLVYSETGGSFFGDMRKLNGVAMSELFSLTAHCVLGYFGLKGVLEKPIGTSTKIPAIVFCIYQLMFAAFTLVILLLSLIHLTHKISEQ